MCRLMKYKLLLMSLMMLFPAFSVTIEAQEKGGLKQTLTIRPNSKDNTTVRYTNHKKIKVHKKTTLKSNKGKHLGQKKKELKPNKKAIKKHQAIKKNKVLNRSRLRK